MAATVFVNEPNSCIDTLTPATVRHQSVFDNAKMEAGYRAVVTFALFYAILIILHSWLADFVDNADKLPLCYHTGQAQTQE